MDNYLSVFRGILATEGKSLDIYLNCLDEHKVFAAQNNDEAGLVQHITSLLTTSTTRFLGLRLLDRFIDNCSLDVLKKKGDLWTTLVLKACNNQEEHGDALLVFHVLDKIIKKSQQVPDLTKSFTSTHISKTYDILTKVPFSKSKYALSCIETCLRVYPGSSGPSRGTIERFLWKIVDDIDYEVTQNCGKCLHLLQQIRGGGVQGVNHKTQWKHYTSQLMGGIHSVYNEMFANCAEIYEEKIEDEKLPWEAEQSVFDTEPVKKAAQMYTRCHNLITYLIIALREPFPVEKPILMKKILNIVGRGLSVNCLMLERNPTADNIALSILLPRLHIDLLNLLTITVTILRGHLRPYSELFLGFMVDELKWTTAKSVSGDLKTLSFLRKKVYDTIALWCKIYHSGNRCETISEQLFQEILSDITPTQSELTLKVLSGSRKYMTKKARRQLHNAQNEISNMAKTQNSNLKQPFSDEKEQELCISALRCLQQIILSVANFMKPTILKMMQVSLTRISAIFYEVPWQPGHLYSNKYCRIEIYNALYAILMATHRLCPPPTELVLANIQNACVRDECLNVRIRCDFILRNLEKIIHPQKESLQFAIEASDIRNTFIKMGQENLLHEFELNLPSDDVIGEVSTTSSNFQHLNTSLSSNDFEEDNNNMETLNTSISENNKEIQNYQLDSTDLPCSAEEFVKEKPNDGGSLCEEPCTTNENVDNLPKCVDNDVLDIATANEEKDVELNDDDIEEPVTKKQKIHDERIEAEGTKDFKITQIIDTDDEQTLDEIASEFIDELE